MHLERNFSMWVISVFSSIIKDIIGIPKILCVKCLDFRMVKTKKQADRLYRKFVRVLSIVNKYTEKHVFLLHADLPLVLFFFSPDAY